MKKFRVEIRLRVLVHAETIAQADMSGTVKEVTRFASNSGEVVDVKQNIAYLYDLDQEEIDDD